MAELEKRIKALESRLCVDVDEQPEAVFCFCVDGSKGAPDAPLPVKGWHHNGQRVMREEGESDEALAQRAIEQVKPSMAKNAVPVFLSINE